MKPIGKRILYWSPRVLTILFAVFISIFALDVFSEAKGFWQTVGYLLLHLVPTALVVGILILAWHWEWIGAVVFLALAILYLIPPWKFPLGTYIAIAGPLIVVGVLFLLNWIFRAQLRSKK